MGMPIGSPVPTAPGFFSTLIPVKKRDRACQHKAAMVVPSGVRWLRVCVRRLLLPRLAPAVSSSRRLQLARGRRYPREPLLQLLDRNVSSVCSECPIFQNTIRFLIRCIGRFHDASQQRFVIRGTQPLLHHCSRHALTYSFAVILWWWDNEQQKTKQGSN